jgi:Fe-S oxidoreductase
MTGGPEPAVGMGLEGLVDDWPARLRIGLRRMADRRRSFRLALENCTGCGACVRQCPIYIASGDPENHPAARIDMTAAMLRRLGGFRVRSGRYGSALAALERWRYYCHQCLLCRACAAACPVGLDPSEVVLAGRELLAEIGLGEPEAIREGQVQLRYGNRLGLDRDRWSHLCSELEDALEDATGLAVRAPVDEAGYEVLYLPGAGDRKSLEAELAGAAKAFHAAGVSWTTSSRWADAGNAGWRLGYGPMKKTNAAIIEAVEELRPKMVVLGESGAGWRVGRNFTDTLNGPLAASAILRTKRPVHVSELFSGLLDKDAFAGRLKPVMGFAVTYHDPCQAARGAGLFDPPRRLIRAAVADFREMPRGIIRENTVCCGGGCGPGASIHGLSAGKTRADAIRAVGAALVATACDNCRTSLSVALADGPDPERPVQTGGLMELFGRAFDDFFGLLTGAPAPGRAEP